MVSWVPTGTVSRSPDIRSAVATQTRHVPLPAEHLGGLAGDVAEPGQHRTGGGQQPVLAGGRGQLAESRTEDESALQVPADQPVVLQSDGESMGGGSGESGRRHQSGQRGRSGLQCAEHESGFVQDADAARVVHALILPSRMLERKSHAESLGEPWQRPPAAPPETIPGPATTDDRGDDGTMPKTLSEKIWDAHVVHSAAG